MSKHTELLGKAEENWKAVNELFKKEDLEIAKDANFKMSAEDRQKVIDLSKAAEDLEVKAAETAEADGIRTKAGDRLKSLSAPNRNIALPGGQQPQGQQRVERKTVGQAFIESPEFQGWLKEMAPSGTLSESGRIGNSPPMEFKADLLASGNLSTDAGVFVIPDFKPAVELPFAPIDILDLITVGTTGSDTVEYPRVTSMTNRSAMTAQADDEASTDNTGRKPSSTMAFVRVTTSVRTLAHWIPATKRAIADAGQLRTLIDNFLREGLRQTLADQIVNGNGAGENFDGILHIAGTTPQAFATNLLTTTRKALTTCRTTALVDPTGFLMSPATWEAIELTQDAEDRYYYGGPLLQGNLRLWGLPIAQENKMPDSSFVTGNLRQVVLWNREQSSIQVSDSHSDFFVKNLVAILAELRAAMGVLRPAALVIGATS